jgi:hypothetical protein
MSAALPQGKSNIEAARKKAVDIQLISAALIENSLPIAGMATIKDETMKGARNDPLADIKSRYFFPVEEAILSLIFVTSKYQAI